jgi:hypothetical protein
MRLHLINPSNPLVSIVRLEESRWSRCRVWHRRQPLINLFGSLSYRRNLEVNRKAYANFSRECATRQAARGIGVSRRAGGLSQGRPSAGVNRVRRLSPAPR